MTQNLTNTPAKGTAALNVLTVTATPTQTTQFNKMHYCCTILGLLVAIAGNTFDSYAQCTVGISGTVTVCNNNAALLEAVGNDISSYWWSTGATTSVITPLAVGTYSVTVTTASSCTTMASIEVNNCATVSTCPIVIYQNNAGIGFISDVVDYNNQLTFIAAHSGQNNYPGYPETNTFFYKGDIVNESGIISSLETNAAVAPYEVVNFVNPLNSNQLITAYRTPTGISYGFNKHYRVWDGITLGEEFIPPVANAFINPYLGMGSDGIIRGCSFMAAGYSLLYHRRNSSGWINDNQMTPSNNIYTNMKSILGTDNTLHVFAMWENNGLNRLDYFTVDPAGTPSTYIGSLTSGIDGILDVKLDNNNQINVLFQQSGDIKLAVFLSPTSFNLNTIIRASIVVNKADLFHTSTGQTVISFYENNEITIIEESSIDNLFEHKYIYTNPASNGAFHSRPSVVLKNNQLHVCFADNEHVYAANLTTPQGTSCNDNNPCTINDIIDTNCNCIGTIQDSDTDGICDAQDTCPTLSGQIGDACNDGNSNTYNDVITAACACSGTPYNCPSLQANIGDACNDGNPNTTNDAVQSNCTCSGTPTGLTPCQQSLQADSLQLVAFYNATGGSGWTYTATMYWDGTSTVPIPNAGNTWLSGSISTWHGVQMTANTCRVQILALNENGLNGNLLDLNLPSLQQLVLDNNGLTGSVPNFSFLQNLQYLILYGNQLSGNIPDFSGLPNLTRLSVNDNQLSGTIPDFSGLPNLTRLYLHNNQLSGTIPDFSGLPNLIRLHLDNNQLSGIIPDFSGLPNLAWLDLGRNSLIGTIPDFNGLPNLQTLYLQSNQLFGTIPDFSNLSNLQDLQLWNNQLSGTIPDFTGLPNLQTLSLTNNQLSGTIPDFSNLPNLSNLSLYFNQLSGTIPNFSGLPNLMGLYLYNNQLSGTIPNFGNSPNLTQLYLWDNQLSGTIPDFNNIPNLQYPYLHNNQLTFAGLPQHIGQYDLFLYSPQSTIPTALTGNTLSVSAGGYTQTGSTCSQFTYNWYAQGTPTPVYTTTCDSTYTPTQSGTYYCEITNSVATALTLSSLPQSVSIGPSACELSLQADSLQLVALYNATGGANWTNNSGWLNSNINTWGGIIVSNDGCNVAQVILQNNNLSGSLPNLALPFLRHLDLGGNQLSGIIPNFNLPNLDSLWLHNNQLSGTIPNFSNMPNLQELVLYQNSLTGNIPDFGNLPNLSTLALYSNQLTGNLPMLTNCPNLQWVYLFDNQLTGSLPNLTWTNLREFVITDNQLSGNIPNVDNLPNLTTLWVNGNQYTFAGLTANIGQITNCPSYFVPCFNYAPQSPIPTALTNSTLSVSAGGYTQTGSTCSQFTYNWYIQGNPTPVYTTTCDSTYTPAQSGTYYCEITNSVATALTLSSLPQSVSIGPSACELSLQADSLQLVALYNATDGANWTNNSGWLTGPVSTWFGVTLTSDGCNVQSISLSNSGLVGNLIDLDLPNLTTLYLCSNQLSSNIPDFSGLPNLTFLNLCNNQLSGTIPDFSGLPNLTTLDFFNNQLSGTIPDFSGLPNLTLLNLWANQLNGNIPDFSSLPNLTNLNFQFNQLTFSGLPQHIGQYPTFNYSPQSQIPTTLTNNTLSVSAGGYTQTGSTCSQFTYNWYAQGNSTPVYTTTCDSTYTPTQSGTYYCEITNSVAVDLTLSSLPQSVSIGPSACELSLQADSLELVAFYNATGGANWTNNSGWLTGPVSTWFGVTLTSDGCNVRLINLFGNGLVGSLIDLNLPNLEQVNFYDNQLSGTIPNFSGLPNLQEIDLANNDLSGTIPDFSGLPNLTWLFFEVNQLTFAGLSQHIGQYGIFSYSPQSPIPTALTNSTLSVSAGGYTQTGSTCNQFTYNWYEIGNNTTPVYTTTCDSTFTPTQSGTYYCRITNSVATALTLTSQSQLLTLADCPALGLNIGDPCDDGNPNTENDLVQSNCTCLGSTIFVCSIGTAQSAPPAGVLGNGSNASPYVVCANTGIALSSAGDFSAPANFPNPAVVWFAYQGQPTSTNPLSDPNASTQALRDAAQVVISNNGNAYFSAMPNTNFQQGTFVLVPVLVPNFPSLAIDPACTGIDLSTTYPTYQILPANDINCTDECTTGTYSITPTSTLGGTGSTLNPYQICADTPINLNAFGNWFGTDIGFNDGDEGIIWMVYTGQPTTENPFSDPNAAMLTGLGNNGEIIFSDGIGYFSQTPLNPTDVGIFTGTFTIVPVLAPDINNLYLDPNCNGVNLNVDYPVFTVIDPNNAACTPFDCPALQANFGDACNDGNANTNNDQVQVNCTCAGTLVFDCPALQANFGDACNDGNANTSNDQVQVNCTCAGTLVFDCPALQLNFGDACNDGNANTNNDQVQVNCTCTGTLVFDCPALQVNFGDACDDGNANTNNDQVQVNCTCAGTLVFDCPALQANFGDACNDGNANTVGDTVQNDCTCSGTTTFDCPALQVNFGASCNDNNPCTTNDVIDTNCNCIGTNQDSDADGICDAQDTCPTLSGQIGGACNDNNTGTYNDVITAACSCVGTPYDCPALQLNFGATCDDGNANTVGDIVQNDCTCSGSAAFDCPALQANFGAICDDGNANTINDQVQDNCTCVGIIAPLSVSLTAQSPTAFCDGGEVVLQASGQFGETPYTWTWRRNNNPISGANANSYTAYTGGNYTVVVSDAGGATSSAAVQVTVYQSPAITINANTCAPDNTSYSATVSIDNNGNTLDASAGTVAAMGNNMFAINGIPVGVSPVLTASSDATTCSSTVDLQAPTCNCPDLPAPSTNWNNQIVCANEPIPLITATIDGNYDIRWLANDGITVLATGNTYQPTQVGDYFVQSFVDNCISEISPIHIEQSDPAAPNLSNQSICANQSAVLDAGNTYSSYLWSNGETTQSITVNTSGNYSVTVNDSNACTAMAEATISQTNIAPPSVTSQSICANQSAVLDAGNTYSSYLWSNGETTQSITVNTSGNYSVTVNDSNACTAMAGATISLLPSPLVDLGDVVSIDCQNTAATIGVLAQANWSYLWSNGATDAQIMITLPNDYVLSVTNDLGCVGTDTIEVVADTAPPIPQILGTLDFCGNSTVLTALGGVSYLWAGGTTNAVLSVSASGIYVVTVTGSNGCTSDIGATVSGALPPYIEMLNSSVELCSDGSVNLSEQLHPNSDASGVWQGLGVVGNGFYAELTVPNSTYTLQYAVETNGACGTVSMPFEVQVKPPVSVLSNMVLEECTDETHYLIAFNATGGIAPYTLYDLVTGEERVFADGDCIWGELTSPEYEFYLFDAENCGIPITGDAPVCADPCAFTAYADQLGEAYPCKGAGFEVVLESNIDAQYQFACRTSASAPLVWQFDNHFLNLEEGLYHVYTKSNLCEERWIDTVSVAPMWGEISIHLDDNNERLCCVDVQGNCLPPLSYLWSNSDESTLEQTSCSRVLPGADTLAVTVEDRLGCELPLYWIVDPNAEPEPEPGDEFVYYEDYVLFPNPCCDNNGQTVLERFGDGGLPATVTIYADNGALMNEFYFEPNERLLYLPVRHYKPGIYLLRVQSADRVWVFKLIIL